MRAVCRTVGAEPEPAVAAIDAARTRAVMHIKRLNSLTGLPKGATFAVRAPASVALPLTQWLYEYLGMVPVAVDPLDGDSSLGGDLRRLLARLDCLPVWKSASFRHADCVFADGATLAVLSTTPEGPAGIEIALPSRGHVDIVEKCVLGAEGALHILEWLLNALIRD
jgi:nitrogenase molybdenum-iron protein alpha/beta subunit